MDDSNEEQYKNMCIINRRMYHLSLIEKKMQGISLLNFFHRQTHPHLLRLTSSLSRCVSRPTK